MTAGRPIPDFGGWVMWDPRSRDQRGVVNQIQALLEMGGHPAVAFSGGQQ